MDIDKIISYIPELLLNFIPGFISIRIKEIYGLQKKHDEFGYTLYCILYSFIILLAYRILSVIAGAIIPPLKGFLNKETVKCCACLVMAVAQGILLAKLPQSKSGSWFGKKVNKLTSPEETVWLKAMKNPKGARAKVFLTNGMIYEGVLINYTSNPDEPCKEVLLYDYKLQVRNANAEKEEDLYFSITKTSKKKDKVLIKRDEIISIEIMPSE